MDKKKIIIIGTIALAVLVLIPEIGCAKDLLSEDLKDEIGNLKDTIFGTPMKIAGIMGAAYGAVQSFTSSSPRPFMMWGAIALLAVFMNKIVSALFGV